MMNNNQVHILRKSKEHDWRTCKDPDCNECQALIDSGIIMACDECDHPGHVDAFGWILLKDGRVVCLGCANKPELQQIAE